MFVFVIYRIIIGTDGQGRRGRRQRGVTVLVRAVTTHMCGLPHGRAGICARMAP
jgi:hypothetical protein